MFAQKSQNNKNVRKLQAVQNFGCRIVNVAKKYDHVNTPIKTPV